MISMAPCTKVELGAASKIACAKDEEKASPFPASAIAPIRAAPFTPFLHSGGLGPQAPSAEASSLAFFNFSPRPCQQISASASLTGSQADGKNDMMAAKKTIAAAMSVSFMASSPMCFFRSPRTGLLIPWFRSRLFEPARRKNALRPATVCFFAAHWLHNEPRPSGNEQGGAQWPFRKRQEEKRKRG